ncbi:hypothetical protein Ancab_016458 [Ancistrocladus abbreviatus]
MMCGSYQIGGLIVIDLMLWNKEAVMKHLWMIVNNKGSLRLRRVHHIYLKEQSLYDYVLKDQASRRVWANVLHWLGHRPNAARLPQELVWIGKQGRGKKDANSIKKATFTTCVYHI